MLDYFKAEVLAHYRDGGGFITVDRNPSPNSTGNGFLHLAFFCSVLAKLGQSGDMQAAVAKTITSAEVIDRPGLFHRNFWKGANELNSWDEYFSICALSKQYGLRFAGDVCAYGVENFWHFDNTNPGNGFNAGAWHDRFLGLTAFYKACAPLRLVSIEMLALCAAVIIDCFSRAADANMRAYVRARALSDAALPLKLCARFWEWQARRKFVTLGAMVKPYFGETHPFSALPWVD